MSSHRKVLPTRQAGTINPREEEEEEERSGIWSELQTVKILQRSTA